MINFQKSSQFFGENLFNQSTDEMVRHGASALKYFHPSAYHCYYSSQETYSTLADYYAGIENRDLLLNNLIYKTGSVFTEMRILYKVLMARVFGDKEIYVMTRSVGKIINIVFTG